MPKVSNRNEVVLCGCGSGKAIDMWWWWRENKSVVVVGVVAMEGQGQIYGWVQGVPKPPPPPPEMTCGFLIPLVFCQKKLCGVLVLK